MVSSTTLPIRVLCVDDLADITAVTRMLIEAEPGMECVGCLASSADLPAKVRELEADIVLLDATIPGEDSFEAMHDLMSRLPEVKSIMYSGYHNPEFIDQAIASGAWGCVSKSDDPEVIMRAVRTVAAGNTFFPR